jgi:hypoxanthine phosphoribosyltransferase
MDYFELSRNGVVNNSLLLADQIVSEWGRPDIVVFISKGAYTIGETIAKQFERPLLEIHASRKANKLKKLLSPLLVLIPLGIKIRLREMEILFGYHGNHDDRDVWFEKSAWEQYLDANKILVVDDSVDTGSTIKSVKSAIRDFSPNSDIRVAALNCFSFCAEDARPDFVLWHDTILNGPWSKDSRGNKQFLSEYEVAKREKMFV